MTRYEVVYTRRAERALRDIAKKHGRAVFNQIRNVVEGLAEEPEQKTQRLAGALAGFRSLHHGRFRIIIKISDQTVRVYVVALGWHESGSRDDIYEALTRLVRAGAIDPDDLE